MPERFDSGVFEPELAKLMKDAFANALAKVHVAPEDREAASHHIAGAIVEKVNAGVRDSEQLTAGAVVGLASAKGNTGEWSGKREKEKPPCPPFAPQSLALLGGGGAGERGAARAPPAAFRVGWPALGLTRGAC